jgi:effector-binding domain-containing protein
MAGEQSGRVAPEVVDMPAQVTAVVRGRVRMEELPAFFDRSFGRLGQVLAAQGVAPTGAAFARYHGPPGADADLEVGFPTSAEVRPDGDVGPGSLPGGRVARATHLGSFDGLGQAWGELFAWVGAQGFDADNTMWEVYVTEPSPEMDPADLRTDLFLALRS